MPKKHKNQALLIKPTVAPSSSNPKLPNTAGQNGSRSVNDLINASRRNGKGKAAALDISNFSSLPPPLRALLNMPEPPPMTTRTQIRGPSRVRRIPGPPPPQSWLQDSQHAPDGLLGSYLSLRWRGARIQQQNSDMPGARFPDSKRLEHFVLKAIAQKWSWHAEYDSTYLSVLPVGLRCTLMSYIAIYNDGHWPNPFAFLFPPDCDQDDLDDVTRLDLANSIGGWATVKKIEQELVVKGSQRSTAKTEMVPQIVEDVPDSWDDELPGSGPSKSSTTQIPRTVAVDHLRFSNLRHLSLAVDPTSPSGAASASWSQLITLSAHLAPLTSLSLAHWPAPTYMPNASKDRIKMKNPIPNAPDIIYNATDPYTGFDNNWREAAGILRSLSRNLYCLTWLDLSGCAPWLNALSWTDYSGETLNADWNGSWRNIEKLILSVGWLPGRPSKFGSDTTSSVSKNTSSIDSERAIGQLYGDSEAIRHSLQEIAKTRLGSWPPVTAADENQTPLWNVEEEREKTYFRRDAERYRTLQTGAKHVAKEIRAMRKSAGGIWIDFEFGDVLTEEQISIW